MGSLSRFLKLNGNPQKAYDENGKLKNGQEFKKFVNKWGLDEVIVIFNWKEGKLHSEGFIPAVQCSDTHTEYWENGKLSNKNRDYDGNLMPAIISNYGTEKEYWIDGQQIEN